MSAFISFLKSLFVPLLISALLYALAFHLLLPLYRRHRARYSQYLPLTIPANSSSSTTSNLRHRVSDALYAFFPNFRFAENWLLPARERTMVVDANDMGRGGGGGNMMDEDEDEELEEGVWDGLDSRRDALDARAVVDSRRRLSRELEEGFMDSSDDEPVGR